MDNHVLYIYLLEDFPIVRQPGRYCRFFVNFSLILGFAILITSLPLQARSARKQRDSVLWPRRERPLV